MYVGFFSLGCAISLLSTALPPSPVLEMYLFDSFSGMIDGNFNGLTVCCFVYIIKYSIYAWFTPRPTMLRQEISATIWTREFQNCFAFKEIIRRMKKYKGRVHTPVSVPERTTLALKPMGRFTLS